MRRQQRQSKELKSGYPPLKFFNLNATSFSVNQAFMSLSKKCATTLINENLHDQMYL